MKNKLLMTTALIGTVALVGAAQSEVKIGGTQEVTYNASSTESNTANLDGGKSGRGIGTETNLTFAGSKDLSNGMKLGSKFNIEIDATFVREYQVTLGQGNAYLAIGNDITQGLNSISAPRVGDHPGTIASGGLTTNFQDGYVENNLDGHLAIGFNNVAGGSLVAIYAPNSSNDNGDSTPGSAQTTGSGYEVTYNGSPVKGVKIGLGMAEKQAADTSLTKDIEAKKVMASYSTGAITAGVEYSDKDTNTTAGNLKSMFYGLTYNAADNLSVGLAYVVTEDDDSGATEPDEKIKLLTVGYNLGGLGLELSYADTANAANARGEDAKVFQARTVIAF